jgi:hypothetical protein
VNHGIHSAVKVVDLGKGFDRLAKVGSIDFRKWAELFCGARNIDVEDFVAVFEEFRHACPAYFAAASRYDYTCHIVLLLLVGCLKQEFFGRLFVIAPDLSL